MAFLRAVVSLGVIAVLLLVNGPPGVVVAIIAVVVAGSWSRR